MMTQTLGYYDLINIAEQNSEQSQREAMKVKLPSYKGSKNKKEDPKSRQLTENVRKFLAKQEDEKRQRAKEAQARKERLNQLLNKDPKAKGRVSRMLKLTKSANKSAIADAKDCLNDSIVDQHDALQPDEDDYGYVSQASIEMHKKLLAQYKTIKKSTPSGPSHVNHVPVPEVKSLSKSSIRPSSQSEEVEKKKPKKPPPSAMLSYLDLLTLAEEKKDIPPSIRVQKTSKEEKAEERFEFGRPMTAKEKEEYMAEKALRDRVAKQVENDTFRLKTTSAPSHAKPHQAAPSSSKVKKSVSFKIPKSDSNTTALPSKASVSSAPKLAEALVRGTGKPAPSKPYDHEPVPVPVTKVKPEVLSPPRNSATKKSEELPPRPVIKVKTEPPPRTAVKIKSEPPEREPPVSIPREPPPLPLNPYMDFVPNISRSKPPIESSKPSSSRDSSKSQSHSKESKHVPQGGGTMSRAKLPQRDLTPPPVKKIKMEPPSHYDSPLRNVTPKSKFSEEKPSSKHVDIGDIQRNRRPEQHIRQDKQNGRSNNTDIYEKPSKMQYEERPPMKSKLPQHDERRKPPVEQYEERRKPPVEQYEERRKPPVEQYEERRKPSAPVTHYEERRKLPVTQYEERRKPPVTQYEERRKPPMSQYDERRKPPVTQFEERRKPPTPQYEERRRAPVPQYEDRRRPPVPQYEERRKPPMPQYEERRKPAAPDSIKKGRQIIDSSEEEDDEEYDSEMDDFIDDSEINEGSISAMIRQITGYDKRKYRPEEDEECMETSAYDQMREESRSLRIGIKEDLEDMRKEEEEKQSKLMKLKKAGGPSKKKSKGLF